MTEWIALAMAVFMLARIVPVMVMANGTRPFMVAFIVFALFLSWRALEDTGIVPGAAWTLPVRRVAFPAILIVTFEWAVRRH